MGKIEEFQFWFVKYIHCIVTSSLLNWKVIQLIIKKYAKFQFDSISSKVIKGLKTHKNAIIFVSHVSQKVLTSATRGHMTLKFAQRSLDKF